MFLSDKVQVKVLSEYMKGQHMLKEGSENMRQNYSVDCILIYDP
jgi:hypothetical protein